MNTNFNDDDNDGHGSDDDYDDTAQDVESHHLQLLLSYMYRGQVLTPHDHHQHQCHDHDVG